MQSGGWNRSASCGDYRECHRNSRNAHAPKSDLSGILVLSDLGMKNLSSNRVMAIERPFKRLPRPSACPVSGRFANSRAQDRLDPRGLLRFSRGQKRFNGLK